MTDEDWNELEKLPAHEQVNKLQAAHKNKQLLNNERFYLWCLKPEITTILLGEEDEKGTTIQKVHPLRRRVRQ